MMRLRKTAGLVLGMTLLLMFAGSAEAELLVSDVVGVPAVTIGAKFSDDHVFRLPANSELKILRAPEDSLFVMHGPYEGTLSQFIRNCSGLLAPTRRYCRNDAAGDQLPTAGTRGAPRDR
jgi:hypothetical protein